MDLDTAYIEPLVHDWLDGVREMIRKQEDLVRAEDEFYMPFIAIPCPIINAIFKITKHLELGPDTKYLTIHLYDKFMCYYFWEAYKAEISVGLTGNSWSQVCNKISSQSKLYLMSCLQLASKMDSHSKSLGISQVLGILKWIDKKSEYTHNTIFSSEFKVFKMIGFQMPLCTPFHCVEILLAAVGLRETPSMYDISLTLLDLVYLQHEKLFSHLQCLGQGHIARNEVEKRSLIALESNVLLLSAAIVLCGSFFLASQNETGKYIASKLTELVGINNDDIWDMANILLIMAIQEE